MRADRKPNRQRDRQTYIQADRNTSHPYRWRSNETDAKRRDTGGEGWIKKVSVSVPMYVIVSAALYGVNNWFLSKVGSYLRMTAGVSK